MAGKVPDFMKMGKLGGEKKIQPPVFFVPLLKIQFQSAYSFPYISFNCSVPL